MHSLPHKLGLGAPWARTRRSTTPTRNDKHHLIPSTSQWDKMKLLRFFGWSTSQSMARLNSVPRFSFKFIIMTPDVRTWTWTWFPHMESVGFGGATTVVMLTLVKDSGKRSWSWSCSTWYVVSRDATSSTAVACFGCTTLLAQNAEQYQHVDVGLFCEFRTASLCHSFSRNAGSGQDC